MFFSQFFPEFLSHEACLHQTLHKSGMIATTRQRFEKTDFTNAKVLVKSFRPKKIALSVKAIKHFINVRMTYRAIFPIRQEILLANIGCVIAVWIFGKQMIERLGHPEIQPGLLHTIHRYYQILDQHRNYTRKGYSRCFTMAPIPNFALLSVIRTSRSNCDRNKTIALNAVFNL